MEQAKAQVAENTALSQKTGDVIARYMLMSQSDPLKLITVAIWKSKEARDKWRAARYPQGTSRPSRPPDAPRVWAKIEGDDYDASQEI